MNHWHNVTIGALLHDIGKVLHRAGAIDGRAHSTSGADFLKKFTDNQEIIDCIRFHHKQEINHGALAADSPAYIVYIADNISSGADRREVEGDTAGGFDKNRQLESVYNLLNESMGKAVFSPEKITNLLQYPEAVKPRDLSFHYNKLLAEFNDGLAGVSFEPEYVNSLIDLYEALFSCIPSSTHIGQVSDISLFDHAKTTAAFAACIALYLENSNRTDYKHELFSKEKEFCNEKAFALLSLDISGIQQFIYTISAKGALKGLRSRSFFLEIMLEHIADEILTVCFLSRANLLYTGGGHAYILLPNTDTLRLKLDRALKNTNRKLMEKFGVGLFVAYGYQACSANELMSMTSPLHGGVVHSLLQFLME